MGSEDGSVVEHRTLHRKVSGSRPGRRGGIKVFSTVKFPCWLLFRYTFYPRVTAVARKLSRSKHACILRMWLRIKWPVNSCMVVWCTNNLRRNSFMWHQPCNNHTALYIRWIFKVPCVKRSVLVSRWFHHFKLNKCSYKLNKKGSFFGQRKDVSKCRSLDSESLPFLFLSLLFLNP